VTRRRAGPAHVFVNRGPLGDMGRVRALAAYGELNHLPRDGL
jgi:hypothetical protein